MECPFKSARSSSDRFPRTIFKPLFPVGRPPPYPSPKPTPPCRQRCLLSTKNKKSRSKVPERGDFGKKIAWGGGGVDKERKGKKDAIKRSGSLNSGVWRWSAPIFSHFVYEASKGWPQQFVPSSLGALNATSIKSTFSTVEGRSSVLFCPTFRAKSSGLPLVNVHRFFSRSFEKSRQISPDLSQF